MNYYIPILFLVSVVILFFVMSPEFKGSFIIPSYVPYIPTPVRSNRGGNMMYIIENLGVPGWKYGEGSCCAGNPSGSAL